MTYFFDNNISPRLARILRLLDVHAVALREEFAQDTPDHVYLTEIKQRGWTLVTCDGRVRTRPPESLALRTAGITSVFIRSFFLEMNLWDQAIWLLRHWREIDQYLSVHRHGVPYIVKQRGRLEPV